MASSSLLSSRLIGVCTENRAVGNALEQTAVIPWHFNLGPNTKSEAAGSTSKMIYEKISTFYSLKRNSD